MYFSKSFDPNPETMEDHFYSTIQLKRLSHFRVFSASCECSTLSPSESLQQSVLVDSVCVTESESVVVQSRRGNKSRRYNPAEVHRDGLRGRTDTTEKMGRLTFTFFVSSTVLLHILYVFSMLIFVFLQLCTNVFFFFFYISVYILYIFRVCFLLYCCLYISSYPTEAPTLIVPRVVLFDELHIR